MGSGALGLAWAQVGGAQTEGQSYCSLTGSATPGATIPSMVTKDHSLLEVPLNTTLQITL